MKLVTLDVTNTCIKIVGSVGLHYASYVYHKTGVRLNEEKVNKYFRIRYKSMMEEHPNFGRYTSMGSRKWWDNVVTNTLKEAGLDKMIAVDQLYDEFITPKHWAVHEDVIEFIRTIRCNGIQVGVISNFDERLDSMLDSLGLSPLFDFVLCSYNEGVHKPHPQIFHKALSIAKVQGNNTWHIGDNYIADYKGAKEAGLNAILIARNAVSNDIPADVVTVTSLQEAVDIVCNN